MDLRDELHKKLAALPEIDAQRRIAERALLEARTRLGEAERTRQEAWVEYQHTATLASSVEEDALKQVLAAAGPGHAVAQAHTKLVEERRFLRYLESTAPHVEEQALWDAEIVGHRHFLEVRDRLGADIIRRRNAVTRQENRLMELIGSHPRLLDEYRLADQYRASLARRRDDQAERYRLACDRYETALQQLAVATRAVELREAEARALERDLERLTVEDPVTGLRNRADFERSMSEMAIGDALVCVDVDGFKKVNDTFGHPEGDRLLAELGHHLEAMAGANGRAYRIGGDEFALILRPESYEALCLRAGRICTSWADLEPVATISVGATVRRSGELSRGTLKRADEAAYVSKRSGGNRARCVM